MSDYPPEPCHGPSHPPGRLSRLRACRAARPRGDVARAGRAPRPDRPQWHRQVLAAEDPRRAGAPGRRAAAAPAGPAAPLRRAGAAVRAGRDGVRGGQRRRGRGQGAARALRGACARRGSGCAAEPHRGAGRLDLGAACHRDARAPAAAGRPGGRRAFRRAEEARGAGAGAGGRARCAAARRADQPPRPGGDRLAAGPAGGLRRRGHPDHARPRLPRRGLDPHPRTGPRPAAQLPRQLQRLRGDQGARARGRGAGQCALRQAAGAGGGLDPQGRGGAPHPQRQPHQPPGGAARAARRAPRRRRQGAPGARHRQPQRQDRV